MSTKKQLDLGRYIPALATFWVNKMSIGATKIYSENFGVTVTEWRILSLLAIESGIMAKRITEVIGLDKATVSRCIRQLEEAGYIVLTPDINDRRSICLQLSETGSQLHHQIIEVALAREAQLLATLTVGEIETLIQILNKLNHQVVKVNALHT